MGMCRHHVSGGGSCGSPKLGIPHFRGDADSCHHPGNAEPTKLMSQVSSPLHQQQQAAASASSCMQIQG